MKEKINKNFRLFKITKVEVIKTQVPFPGRKKTFIPSRFKKASEAHHILLNVEADLFPCE
jgi:hypothetical protein